MAHTNETANYHLSQFVGTDIPNPLVDYNGDMVKIDTAIKGVADASAGYASDIADIEIQNGSETLTTTAQTLSGAVNELDGEVGDINTRLTTAEGKITADEGTLATAVGNISTLAGKVGAVETKVGTAVLTTVAPDLSGAVNELKAEIDGAGSSIASRVTALETQAGSEVLVTTAQTLSGAINELAGGTGAISASNVTYDNTTSGLTADDVQEAIDEVAGDCGVIKYDNTDSGLRATNVQDAIDEVASKAGATLKATATANQTYANQLTQLQTAFNNLTADEKAHSYLAMGDLTFPYCYGAYFEISGSSTGLTSIIYNITNATRKYYTASTEADQSSITNPYTISLYA